ncbi:MAG: hypothetical protein HOQ06_04105 [Pseudarthrobacter sp.]|nr:hypothetical protein [Pseudarthrobacter sp.]
MQTAQVPAEHLRRFAGLAEEVAAAESARTAIERKRAQVLALARKSRLLDVYQLACASRLKHDEICKMTTGLRSRIEQLRQVLDRPGTAF